MNAKVVTCRSATAAKKRGTAYDLLLLASHERLQRKAAVPQWFAHEITPDRRQWQSGRHRVGCSVVPAVGDGDAKRKRVLMPRLGGGDLVDGAGEARDGGSSAGGTGELRRVRG